MFYRKIVSAAGSVSVALSMMSPLAGATEGRSQQHPIYDEQPPQRAKVMINNDRQEETYDDREVAQLLLAGQGKIAEDKPELLNVLGFSPEKPTTDLNTLDLMLDDYLATVPDFHQRVTVPFQSNDPQQVETALVYLSETFLDYAESRRPLTSPDDANLQGWTWMGANVVVYANAVGVANAVGYANVAVATLAVATIAVVTWYLPDSNGQASTIDRQERIAKMTSIMAHDE